MLACVEPADAAPPEMSSSIKEMMSPGEFQAAGRLAEAAAVIGREPVAIQLRYLQTLAEIATENNSTIIFPVPVDMLQAFMSSLDKRGANAT